MALSIDPEHIICSCFGLTAKTLADYTRKNKLIDAGGLAEFCPLGSGCGTCWSQGQQVVDAVNNEIFPSVEAEEQKLYLQSVVNRVAKRKLAKQGATVVIKGVDGNLVAIKVSLSETGDFFPALDVCDYVQSVLQDKVHKSLIVKEV